MFTAPAGMTSNDNGLEIFDAPNEGNSFVTTNKEEEKMLLTDEYQDKLAWGIYNGIMDYFHDTKE